MKSIYLQISTFQGGFAINAIHYYGCLKFRTDKTETVDSSSIVRKLEEIKKVLGL